MNDTLMGRLSPIGCTAAILTQYLQYRTRPCEQLMRLVEMHRETLRVHDGIDDHVAHASAAVWRRHHDYDRPLAVGDWVLVHALDDRWEITDVLPPTRTLTRRDAHGCRHTLVHNVDTAFVVMGLDHDFSPRRLERYLAMLQPSGIEPVVVLSKRDVATRDVAAAVEALAERLGDALPIVALDGRDPGSAQVLAPWLRPGQTVVLLGSSGAGKSTLSNTLLGDTRQTTGAVRARDGRGQHTTTTRSLRPLPQGACLIDTPGLRAMSPDIDEAALDATFSDIAEHATQCRFRDCTHTHEPGCAVRDHVAQDRLRSYDKLLREVRRETITPLDRRKQLSEWKARMRSVRTHLKNKRST